MSFPFTITEQILPGAYIREFPHALSTSQESTLRLAVKIYTPKDNTSPQPGDVTLIAAHANGFPKELYEAMWADLHAEAAKANPPFRIRQIIAVDAAWQNASAPLNEHLLGNDPGWLDYPRDMLHILNTLRPPQPLVGVGHSFGGNAIANLALLHPRLLSTVILLDPVISRWSSNATSDVSRSPAAMSIGRRDLWPSRDAARAAFAKSPFYRAWDPRVLDAWLAHGLRDTPTPLYPEPGHVTLATTRHQEVFTYFRPSWDAYAADGTTRDLVPDLDPALSKGFVTYPVYRAEGANTLVRLPSLRPGCLYLFGGTSDLSLPELRDEKMRLTGTGGGGSGGAPDGRVEAVTLPENGHLVPMEVPGVCAAHAARWIAREMVRWRREQADYEAWTRKSVEEKTLLSDEWKKRLVRPPKPGKTKTEAKI
ncbi:Abhydrolase domain-containing protein mpaH like [Verticillium longisporum]|uniref:Abhydrolase domain-containing protein mpaH like n=1 Tax=Verticillium longisporum TaxID=100787 RepID=A0A8I2ZBS5_VERLO|nr:Abhydrolase domain-containing protein mpaH like [Verticillium longisporum]